MERSSSSRQDINIPESPECKLLQLEPSGEGRDGGTELGQIPFGRFIPHSLFFRCEIRLQRAPRLLERESHKRTGYSLGTCGYWGRGMVERAHLLSLDGWPVRLSAVGLTSFMPPAWVTAQPGSQWGCPTPQARVWAHSSHRKGDYRPQQSSVVVSHSLDHPPHNAGRAFPLYKCISKLK